MLLYACAYLQLEALAIAVLLTGSCWGSSGVVCLGSGVCCDQGLLAGLVNARVFFRDGKRHQLGINAAGTSRIVRERR